MARTSVRTDVLPLKSQRAAGAAHSPTLRPERSLAKSQKAITRVKLMPFSQLLRSARSIAAWHHGLTTASRQSATA